MSDDRLFSRGALDALALALRDTAPPLELWLADDGSAVELWRRMQAAALELEHGSGGAIRVRSGVCPPPPDGLPALSVAVAGRSVAHYLAVPDHGEGPPFLDLLLTLAQASHLDGPASAEPDPARLTVFISPGCPNCPHAVRTATQLAAASRGRLIVSVVDATAYAEIVAAAKIQSVPTTVVNGDIAEVGVIPRRRLLKLLDARSGPEHERELMASQLAGGRFDDVAERLTASGASAGCAAFAALWRASTLETRIGLMLSAESALTRRRDALDALVPELAAGLADGDRAHRGDTADLLARIGDLRARPALERLLADPDPELAEAAADALVRLQSRNARVNQGQ